ERRPVLLEQRRHAVLVEADPVVAPALVPEGRVHVFSVGRGYAPDMLLDSGRKAVGGVAPTYSTERPSTFCQPRGSSPPRLARAPTYWSRSLNDSDMVRAPDFTDSVPPGDTAAMATTCSVPRLALGISMILLPLPLSSSGSSETGNASRCPALVTATTRSVSTEATGAGCSTRAPLSVPSDSSDLPAFCRPVRFSKRVTKP